MAKTEKAENVTPLPSAAPKITVDKDVPIPERRVASMYPWDEMEPGHSFAREFENEEEAKRRASGLRSAAQQKFGKGNYTVRVEGTEIRVWRLA